MHAMVSKLNQPFVCLWFSLEWTQKESINTTPRCVLGVHRIGDHTKKTSPHVFVLNLMCDFRNEEQAQSTAVPDEELKMKYLRKAHSPDSAVTGGLVKKTNSKCK